MERMSWRRLWLAVLVVVGVGGPSLAALDPAFRLQPGFWELKAEGQATAEWETEAVVLRAADGAAATARLDNKTPVTGNFQAQIGFELLDWQVQPGQQALLGVGVMTVPAGGAAAEVFGVGRGLTDADDLYHAGVFRGGEWSMRAGGRAKKPNGQFRLTRLGTEFSVAYLTEPEEGGVHWQMLGQYEIPENQPLVLYLTSTNQAPGVAQFANVRVRFHDNLVRRIKPPQVPEQFEPYVRPKPPEDPQTPDWVIYRTSVGWLKVGARQEYLAPQKVSDEIGGGTGDQPLTKVLLHGGFATRAEALASLCDYLTKVVVQYNPTAPPKELVTAIYEGESYKLRLDRGNAPDSVLSKAGEYDFAAEKAVMATYGLTPRAAYPKQWIVHATGHGTTSGPVTDNKWMLITSCPRPDPKGGPQGFFEIADGYGGTFTYSCDKWEGPYRDNYGLGKAMKRLGVDTLEAWPPGNNYNRQIISAEIADQPTDYGPEVLGIQPIVDPAELREWVVYAVGDTYLRLGTRKEFEKPVLARELPNFGTGDTVVPKREIQTGGKSYSYECALEDLCRLFQKPTIGFHPLSEPRETVEADLQGKHYILQLTRPPDALIAGYGGYNVGAEIKTLAAQGILAKKTFKPQWLVHSTGHGTMNGPVKDDFWMMVAGAPNNGTISIPDGMGGTFTHSVDGVGGPFTDNVALAQALQARGLKSIGLYGEDRSVSVEEAINAQKPPAPKAPRLFSVAPAEGEPGTAFYVTVITANTRPCHRFRFGPDIVVTDETCLGRDPDDAGRERWLATVSIPSTVKVGTSYPGTIIHPCTRSPLPPSPPGPPLVVKEPPKKPPLVIVLDIDGMRQDLLYEMLCKGVPSTLAKILGAPVTSNAASLVPYEAHTSMDPKSRIEFENGIGLLNSTAVFPSYTFCAQASIFTGNPPCQTGIPGNQFFDRRTGYQFDFTGNEWYNAGLAPGDAIMGYAEGRANKNLRCDTLYDRLPPGTKYEIIYNMYYGKDWSHYWHIGHSAPCNALEWPRIMAQYGLYYAETTTPVFDRGMADVGIQQLRDWIAAAKQGGKTQRTEPWVLTLYFSGVDHWAHAYGIDCQTRYLTAVVDSKVREIYELLEQEGVLEDTVWVLTADHGHTNVNGAAQPGIPATMPKGYAITQRYSHNLFRNAPGGDLSRLCYANLGYTPHDVNNAGLVVSVNGGLGYVNVSEGLKAPPPESWASWAAGLVTPGPGVEPGAQWRSNPSEADVVRVATAVARANRDGVSAPDADRAGVEQPLVAGKADDLLPPPGGLGPTLKGALNLILMRKPPAGVTDSRHPYEVFSLDSNDFPKREDLLTYLYTTPGQALLDKWGWRVPNAGVLIERRIQQTNCSRSGDLLLVPDYPRYYFEYGECLGSEHGSLLPGDIYVPFIVAQVPPANRNKPEERKRLRAELFKTMRASFGDPQFPSNMDTARVVVNLCKAWARPAPTAAGGPVPRAAEADAGGAPTTPTNTTPPAATGPTTPTPPEAAAGVVGANGQLDIPALKAILGNRLGEDKRPTAPNAALPAATTAVHLYVEMKEASPDGMVWITIYQGDRVSQKRNVQAFKGDRFVVSFFPRSADTLPAGKWSAVIRVGDRVVGTIPFTVGAAP